MTSKCLKFLPKFAVLIAVIVAGASTSALAAQYDSSQCDQGGCWETSAETTSAPTARVCILASWPEYNSSQCDQGGCWGASTGTTTALIRVDTRQVVYIYSGTDKDDSSEVKAEIAQSCDVIR